MADAPIAKRRKGRRLKSFENCRTFTAHVLRQIEAGTIDLGRAKAMLQGAQVLVRILEAQAAASEQTEITKLKRLAVQLQEQLLLKQETERTTIDVLPAHCTCEHHEPDDAEGE